MAKHMSGAIVLLVCAATFAFREYTHSAHVAQLTASLSSCAADKKDEYEKKEYEKKDEYEKQRVYNSLLDTCNLQNALERIKARNGYLCTTNTDNQAEDRHYTLGGTPAFHAITDGVKTMVGESAPIVSLLGGLYQCPFSLERSNIVSTPMFDGGKWMCGLEEMIARAKVPDTPKCVVYSFGSADDDLFEDRLLKRHKGCEIHIYDPTSGPQKDWEQKYTYHKLGLCVQDVTKFTFLSKEYGCLSLKAAMKANGHDHLDMLKIDVQGSEWKFLKVQDWKGLNIGQIQMEVHLHNDQCCGLTGVKTIVDTLKDYFIPLEKAGYFPINLEPGAATTRNYEIVWLNVNWDPKTGVFDNMFTPDMYPSTPNVAL